MLFAFKTGKSFLRAIIITLHSTTCPYPTPFFESTLLHAPHFQALFPLSNDSNLIAPKLSISKTPSKRKRILRSGTRILALCLQNASNSLNDITSPHGYFSLNPVLQSKSIVCNRGNNGSVVSPITSPAAGIRRSQSRSHNCRLMFPMKRRFRQGIKKSIK